jgi:spermidine synthase
MGDVFAAFAENRTRRAVGVVGLGAGSLASYSKTDEAWTFFEINPAVVRFASRPDYFSFLSESKALLSNTVLGDARLSLENVEDGAYGLLVLDAFSSDAIPVHLVTREALELYLRKMTPDGILAFHITNRYLHLEPVLGRLAGELGVVARTRNELDSGVDMEIPGREPSQWLVMARSEDHLGLLRGNSHWRSAAVPPHTPVWTDDFSNIVSVLRW